MRLGGGAGTLVAAGVVALGVVASTPSFRDEAKRLFPEFHGAIALTVERTAEVLASGVGGGP